jgi:hypothetical protein
MMLERCNDSLDCAFLFTSKKKKIEDWRSENFSLRRCAFA